MLARTRSALALVLTVASVWGCGSNEDGGAGEDPAVVPVNTGEPTPPPPGPAAPTPSEPGAAGSEAPPAPAEPGAGAEPPAAMDPAPTIDENPYQIASRRGLCDLYTGWPGDDACLAPPAPEEGFQIHIGPDDYEDQAQIDLFLMAVGDESSECFMKKTTNDRDVHHLVYELSGRDGTHHIINTLLSEDLPEGWGSCRSFAGGSTTLGRLGGASKPHMPPIPVAPENEGLGIPLGAHTQGQHDMHYFNFTDQPIIREFWMNVYYVPDEEVTQTPNGIAGLGGLSWNFRPIQPGTHQSYSYECAIDTPGRIIQLLGHTHAHGIRETAWIRRAGGERLKVYEQFDYLEPQIFMFDSVTQNPPFGDGVPGAYTGILEVSAGDVLEWECEVLNDSASALTYTNEVVTGEMCNIWGMSVGPRISCYLQ